MIIDRATVSLPPGISLIASCGVVWALAVTCFLYWGVRRPPSRGFLLGALVMFGLVALAFALATGLRHDYVHFVEQWNHTMRGGDPWDQSLDGQNPGYGPLFNAFAPLATLFPLLPKLVFTAVWVGTTAAVLRFFQADGTSSHLAPAVLGYFTLTPYFWVEIAGYGHFDILPAAATLAAVHLTLRHREGLGAGALALGVLLKIYPLPAFPLLLTARIRRWWVGTLAFTATCIVVIAASYAIWGSSTFSAVLLPGRQKSDLFSIFRFARGTYSPLRLFTDTPNLDAASVPLMGVAGVLLVLGLGGRRSHLVVSVLVTFVSIFALFKLGHPQFQMVVFVLAPYLLLTLRPAAIRSRLLLGTLGGYLAWFTLLDIVYVLGAQLRDPPWVELREILGLPTFVLAVALVMVLMRLRQEPVMLPDVATTGASLGPERVSEPGSGVR